MKLPENIEKQGFIATAYRVPLLGELFLTVGGDKLPVVLEYDDDLISPSDEICHIIVSTPRWRAEIGSYYHYVTLGSLGEICQVHFITEEYDQTDNKLHEIGNYFETKEEAQKVLEFLLLTLKNGI
jgi:hypothetical protein